MEKGVLHSEAIDLEQTLRLEKFEKAAQAHRDNQDIILSNIEQAWEETPKCRTLQTKLGHQVTLTELASEQWKQSEAPIESMVIDALKEIIGDSGVDPKARIAAMKEWREQTKAQAEKITTVLDIEHKRREMDGTLPQKKTENPASPVVNIDLGKFITERTTFGTVSAVDITKEL